MEDGWEQLFDKSFTNRDRSTGKMKGYFDARFLAALGPNTPNILNVPLFLAEGELYGEDGRLEIKDPTVSLTIPAA